MKCTPAVYFFTFQSPVQEGAAISCPVIAPPRTKSVLSAVTGRRRVEEEEGALIELVRQLLVASGCSAMPRALGLSALALSDVLSLTSLHHSGLHL
ncbi:hypothetical protein CDL15_Pgr029101 [Punica granatum]|uniref:Uncharacterized protein n=1 Tax=Punica granatum TaxID=22663 RepID=A0A218XLM0_PUNGR|nr:hypothetical protein CDL15_Pgr029101 [Punica granatum]